MRPVLLALLLAGCATTQSGVLAVKRIDRTQFEVTSHVIGSLSGVDAVKTRNDETATKFCAQNGGPMIVVDRHSYGGVASQDILTFRCGSAPQAKATAPNAAPDGSAGLAAKAVR